MVNGYCYDCELLRPRMDFHTGIPHCPDCHGDFVELLETWTAIGDLQRFLFRPNRQTHHEAVTASGTSTTTSGNTADITDGERIRVNSRVASGQQNPTGRPRRGVEVQLSFVTDGRSVMPLEDFLQAMQRAGEASTSPAPAELLTLLRQKARPADEFYEFFRHVDGAPNNNQCTICLDAMGGKELITRLDCTHVFHLNCLISWLEQQHTCPVCRATCSASNV
ncbi:hypothetical protein XU18_0122 [Perkinsela sp. CCAP 1560/4]|nr:hypothetical protein XU18_0122 [Perkinsela sp. CCAP 1560/4]|eukprot:KNH09437.1 hypothetical protein XU18_0122 [Perkinsela sp. CCAP 1560/4]